MTQETTLTYLDNYCERAGDPSLWAEPLGAVSNIVFIVFAFLALKAYQNNPGITLRNGWTILLLIVLLGVIGMGSGAYHTSPNQWTLLADIIPITLFINVYLLIFIIQVARYHWGVAIAVWLAFQAVGIWFQLNIPPDTLNGTIMYIPTYLFLAGFTATLYMKHHPSAKDLLWVLSMWTISLFYRTIDMTVCETLPTGTHFMWHICNSLVLYHLIIVVIKNVETGKASRPR